VAFEHAETTWSEWLKTVQAGRPPNVKVTGQPVGDELQGTVQVASVEHLADPLNFIQAGHREELGAVAAQYCKLEIIAVVPMWLRWFVSAVQDCFLYVVDVPLLAAHAAPAVAFSGAPRNLVIGGTEATAPPAKAPMFERGTSQSIFLAPEIYVPRGRVFTLSGVSVNVAADFGVFWREIPQTR
jgi:hypothetical protein